MKLLSMSGFVPEQICDVIRFTGYKGERNISHYCGYANDFISQVIADDGIDGAIFPKSCDSSRIIRSYLQDCDKFIYQMVVPSRTDDMAADFLAEELKNYKRSIESYFQTDLGDLKARVNLLNERNKGIALAYHSLEEMSYGIYLRAIHACMQKPLCEQKINIKSAEKINGNKRVFLIGSFLANESIADMIETCGLKIVGDDLPESGRIRGSVIEDTGSDVFGAIASNMLKQRMSPTQNNFEQIISKDLAEMKSLGIDAVIFVTQKYCEPYEYLYSVFKKRLDQEGIPSLKISVSDSEDDRKVRLFVEAFADMI
jgi:benzoyl-CoA reductase/2-hydroxyglutaryl-CoA dehydratase subunit BcrC/BadD/HgdB